MLERCKQHETSIILLKYWNCAMDEKQRGNVFLIPSKKQICALSQRSVFFKQIMNMLHSKQMIIQQNKREQDTATHLSYARYQWISLNCYQYSRQRRNQNFSFGGGLTLRLYKIFV